MKASDIKAERLEEIRDSCTVLGNKDNTATPEEDAAIREEWKDLPGSYSYYDVVCKLLCTAQWLTKAKTEVGL